MYNIHEADQETKVSSLADQVGEPLQMRHDIVAALACNYQRPSLCNNKAFSCIKDRI